MPVAWFTTCRTREHKAQWWALAPLTIPLVSGAFFCKKLGWPYCKSTSPGHYDIRNNGDEMQSQADYVKSEKLRALKEIFRISEEYDRNPSPGQELKDMCANHADVVLERAMWVFNGHYGRGAYELVRQRPTPQAMAREALCLAGVLEYLCSPSAANYYLKRYLVSYPATVAVLTEYIADTLCEERD